MDSLSSFPSSQLAPVSDLQRNYAFLIQKVKETKLPLWVLKNNKPEAVLISPEIFEGFLLKLRQFEEQEALTAISFYEKEKKMGKLKKTKKISSLFK